MEIQTKIVNDVTVAEITGELDGKTAPVAQKQIVPLCQDGGNIILDMSGVTYMSSAGLRLLLSLYRQASAAQAKLALVGLSDDLKDTMSATGFLDYFTVCTTPDEAIAALQQG